MPANNFQILVLGAEGVGKTTLTSNFLGNLGFPDFESEPTFRKVTVNNETYHLDVKDLVGEDEGSAFRDQMMRLADGFLILYSITDLESFALAKNFRTQLLNLKKQTSHIVLVGTKSDLESERTVTSQQGKELGSEWEVAHMEVSALVSATAQVEPCFLQLVKQMTAQTQLDQITKAKPIHKKIGKFLKKRVSSLL